MPVFTYLFIAALLVSCATRLWLAHRQIAHIQTHRSAVPAEFASQIQLRAHQKAADYSSAKTRLNRVDMLVDTALLLLLTFGGGIEALSRFWVGVTASSLYQSLGLIISVLLISSLAGIPLSLYRTFVIETRFGFNKMSLSMFITDLIKQSLVGAAFGIPLLLLVLWLMEKTGSLWWLYAWGAWVVFNLLVLAIYPTFIAPLFNKFSPLEDTSLKARIEQLLKKCGFKSQGLFVMDSSKRSSHGNAYFTGFGASKRIVLFDTLISRLSGGEIEAILAHELGHFKHRHVVKRMVWTFAVSLFMLALLGFVMQKPWFYQGLNVTTQSTGTALILFFLALPVFTFLLQPLSSIYSRKHEFEADRYAAQNASADDLVQALVKLYQDNASTLTPDPLHSAFYDSHPPASIRIARLQGATA